MNVENALEKLLHHSFQVFLAQPELPELKSKLEELHQKGFRFGFIDTLKGDIEANEINSVSLPEKWFVDKHIDVAMVLADEKKASVQLQDFEYAAHIRTFETYLHDNILDLSNPELVLKIIKLRLEYCVICKGQSIYFFINTPYRKFKLALLDLVNNLKTVNHLKLEETSFMLKSNKELARLLPSFEESNSLLNDDDTWVYLVHTTGENPKCLFSFVSNFVGAFTLPVSFLEHLSGIPRTDFTLLTVLVTHFRDLKIPILRFKGEKHPLLDVLLAESGGWIAYPYQLENIFRLATGLDMETAITFRRNVNKKNIKGYNTFLDAPICGTTLGQVMQERMVTEFVKPPDYAGAQTLFNHFVDENI